MEAARSEFKKMSYEEFLDWCDEDTLAEWVDGEIIMYSPASNRHQDIGDFLVSILRIYTETNNLGIVLSAPFQMKLPGDLPGREPDLIFISTANRHRLRDTYFDGPADVAVEIISEESISRDREDKFLEYEISGVPEYWLIDPLSQEAEFYRIGKDSRYHQVLPDSEGIYHCQAIKGFWLKVDWLWQEPLPHVLDVLRELGVL